ncbi:MAG: hypothetical protein HYW49_03720, partial [Deltaproteobacteria bacterium]|nr:hypothetical protein [Deltaproteobacteria bacterium]
IKNFAAGMRESLRANVKQIEETKELLKLKMLDWNTRVVITQLGTSGNGKTEFFKAMAKAVYADSNAYYKISGITDKYKLANFFRPPTGIQGGMEETDFERWVKSRMHSGGGVIILDELLSFHGMSPAEVGHKVEAINELYDLLDEGFLRVGNQLLDVRGFVIGITGNALQEAFAGIGDDPDSERLIQQVTGKIKRGEVVKYFQQYSIDPPKVARFGKIFVNGPLPRSETMEVGRIMMSKTVEGIKSALGRDIELVVPDAVIEKVVTNLTTVQLGMREVEKGFSTLIKEPASGILADIAGVKKLEAKLDGGTIRWYAGGKEVVLEGVKLDASGIEERNWVYKSEVAKGTSVRTPQISDLELPSKTVFSEESFRMIAIHEVYGHWMTGVLVNGVNGAEAISLVPGDGYGGYVRQRFAELAELDTLTSMMKQVVELEAGHRAVFLIGKIYAAGGGPESAEALKGRRADDIGKVKSILEKTLHNQLLHGYSELSSPAERKLFMTTMKELGVLAADRVMEKGVESGQFEEVFNAAVKERYLSGEQLDDFVRKIDFAKIGHPDVVLFESLADAAVVALGRSDAQSFAARKALIEDFLRRVHVELGSRLRGSAQAGVMAELGKAYKKVKSQLLELKGPNGCTELLHKGAGAVE